MSERLDLLNRKGFVDNVIKLVNQLSENKKGCCFAIEGSWGIGKTFVIEEIKEKIKLEETNSDRYFVFYYNCWQQDYYEEPAVAIISAMLASIKKDEVLVNVEAESIIKAGYEFVGEELKKIAGLYVENKIGINIISWAENIRNNKKTNKKAEHEFDQMFNFGQTIEKVRKKLEKIAEERTIVLFVDELDRCVPQYTIKVLERLHHIFYGLDNVIVVMAIDRKQLEHSVEEMFGARKDDSSIDIEKYLKKFIDFSVVLDNGRINEFYREKYKTYFDKFVIKDNGDVEEMMHILTTIFIDVDIRRQEKIVEKANIVHSLVCNEKIDISVLIFEIMYEVLKLWGFGDLRHIAVINDEWYTSIEEKIGTAKMGMLKSFSSKAYKNVRAEYAHGNMVSYVYNNIYGKVFWYFVSIFYKQKLPYIDFSDMQEVKHELAIVKKYCELCEVIK